MVVALAGKLGVELAPRRLVLPNGSRMEIDGATEDWTILAEAWAHQGAPRGAQVHKVARDALKLVVASRVLEGPRLILLFSDEAAAAPFRGASWIATALREFAIEVQVVPLPVDIREAVHLAQRRQFR
jgi:hypothetical protein